MDRKMSTRHWNQDLEPDHQHPAVQTQSIYTQINIKTVGSEYSMVLIHHQATHIVN